MAKRSAGEAFDGNEVYLKRQKLTTGLNLAQNGIHNGAQLRQALAFDQDLRHAKQGKDSQIMSKIKLLTISAVQGFKHSNLFSITSPNRKQIIRIEPIF
jgi:hypothetical protein